jgi:DNA-binding NtrC family response regulator
MSSSPATGAAKPGILAIDDDAAMRQSVARALRTEGFGETLLCGDPREAADILEHHDVGAVLLDLVMPFIPGETLLATIMTTRPEIPVIVVTATNEIETAVRCVKAGAFDYLTKPVDFSRLLTVVARALRQHELRAENRRLQQLIREPQLHRPECFAPILARSPAMRALFRQVEAVAPSSEPVLIVGETGVGKELVARALHAASGRAGEMVAVNVAGIDETAFADTLFGHAKGAFTGADRDREGLIERAGEGTLFLDEIGDLGMDMQTKLLRLIQENEFFPLGSDFCRRSRCRVIAATNRDLRVRMREGRFREDLYYRLHGHLIRVPPLRERAGDIPLLVEHFLEEASASLGKPVPTVPKELVVHLSAYAFPGNVRELRAMVVDAVVRHDKGVLSLNSFHSHMDEAAREARQAKPAAGPADAAISFGRDLPTLEQATRTLIAEAIKRADGNQGAAARLLDISRRTISRHLGGSASGSAHPDP